MGEVKALPQKTVVVNCGGTPNVLLVSDIRALAQGRDSIAEYGDPESLARSLAVMALQQIDSMNCGKIDK